ncbi:DUF4398 domain-containing protein [Zoogloea dura]|uniref:DUF4398 domain-containing protein n=1 Tax=Zoogloea dura TaxID=2728840 RepID=A0A848FW29_9RHOO|nr:DUF4398 domain-containing protein [Zoogloea dura]NML24147.1 DUF4398 domain-containing protein [Zoogloea dura]
MKAASHPTAPPRPLRRRHLPVLLASLGLFLAACAGLPAPTEQLAVSTAAVSRAGGAGGGEMAPAEMQMAREKLAKAQQAMADEDYGTARDLAREAQVDAQLAEAKALSAKARKAADELNAGNRVLRDEMDRKNK